MAPSHTGGQPAAAVVYLPYGSTALWLLCYAAFSMLPFHMLLLQQSLVVSWRLNAWRHEVAGLMPTRHLCVAAKGSVGRACRPLLPLLGLASCCRCATGSAVPTLPTTCFQTQAMVLLAGSRSMCQESAGLRIGYAALHTLLQRAQQAARDWRLPLIPGWPALASAFSFAPGGLVCPASSAEEPCTAQASIAAACGADGTPSSLVRLCIDYQVPVLLGSFALSTWLAYRAELRSRLAWLTHMRHSTFSGTATVSGGSASGSGSGDRSDSGSAQPPAAPDASAAALRRAVDFELIGPLPNDAVYWLQLALPCMLCIGIVVRAVF